MYSRSELNVGATSPPPISPNSSIAHELSPQKSIRLPDLSPCFRCHKLGHWSRNCPEKSPSPFKSQQASPITRDSEFPHPLRCRCGVGDCLIFTSRTASNPGRKFYLCPGTTGRKCGMFKWCDEVTMEEIESPPLYRFPECNCGAGTCNLIQLKSGINAGKKCFVCPIDKGDGACSFFQLFDAQRDTIVNGQVESQNLSTPYNSSKTQSKSDLVEDRDLSPNFLKKRDFEVPAMDNFENPSTPLVISVYSKRNKVLTPEADICIPQRDITRQVASTDAISVEGINTNYTPNHVPKDADVSEKLDPPFHSTPAQDTHISSGAFRDYNTEHPNENLMKGSISEAFKNAAHTMQTDLLNLLDSLDILDHEAMLREAKLVFSALGHLGLDNSRFRARVMDFIMCASSLATIETSLMDDMSSQELVDREKGHFEYLTRSHAEVAATLTASKKRVRVLRQEASDLRDKLVMIEDEISACEVESTDLETRVVEITKEMSLSQQSLQAASQVVEEASKICKEKIAERDSAKAALEKAKLELKL